MGLWKRKILLAKLVILLYFGGLCRSSSIYIRAMLQILFGVHLCHNQDLI